MRACASSLGLFVRVRWWRIISCSNFYLVRREFIFLYIAITASAEIKFKSCSYSLTMFSHRTLARINFTLNITIYFEYYPYPVENVFLVTES